MDKEDNIQAVQQTENKAKGWIKIFCCCEEREAQQAIGKANIQNKAKEKRERTHSNNENDSVARK
jgi:hypothetical protein